MELYNSKVTIGENVVESVYYNGNYLFLKSVDQHRDRIIADGGTVVDISFLHSVISEDSK
jgi:hypothetical protein